MKSSVVTLLFGMLLSTVALAGDDHLFWLNINVKGFGSQQVEAWTANRANGDIGSIHVHNNSATVAQIKAGATFNVNGTTINVKADGNFTAQHGGNVTITASKGPVSKTVAIAIVRGSDWVTYNSSGQYFDTINVNVYGPIVRISYN